MYLKSYGRALKMGATDKTGNTRQLDIEKEVILQEKFNFLNIPFRVNSDGCLCVVTDGEINDSRVKITIDGEMFNISNYNSYLFGYSEANKIKKAFENKGIESSIERFGGRNS